jgi:trk system potassium uptake protein TrkA
VKRIAVIGLGQFGTQVARELTRLDVEVLAIDRRAEPIEGVRRMVAQAMVLDAMDEAALGAAQLDDVDSIVVATGSNLEASILITAQLVRLGLGHIVARAATDLHEQVLRLVGAHDVVNPEAESGRALAASLVFPELKGRVRLPSEHEYAEIDAPPSFLGRSVADLGLRAHYGVHLIAIRKHEPRVTADGRGTYQARLVRDPDDRHVIAEGDRLGLIGTAERLAAVASL